jgi:hypothetical protein
MARDTTEKQHDEAVRVLRAEYYSGVRVIVDDAMEEIKRGGIESREGLDEYLWQSIDGSYWVIYTHANFQVIFVSDNHDAYMEDYGEPPVEGGDIKWAALAFAAMRRDVDQLVGAHDEEIEELLNPEEEEEDEDLDEAPRPREAPRATAPRRRRPPPQRRQAKAPRKKAPRKAPRRRR